MTTPIPEPIDVYWRDECVGQIVDYGQDMWYIDGTWKPAEGKMTTQFQEEIKHLTWEDFQSVQNPDDFVWVELFDNRSNAVVVSLMKGNLCVRTTNCMFPPDEP